jgi:hypothetical protein
MTTTTTTASAPTACHSTSSITTTAITAAPYHGYTTLVPVSTDATVAGINGALSQTITALSTSTASISKNASSASAAQSLLEDCRILQSYIAETEAIPAYKLSLIKALSHYLTELPKRNPAILTHKTTSDARFNQLSRLVYALTSSELERQHPSLLLSECDAVIAAIDREERSKSFVSRAFSSSSLRRCLEPAVARQWIPILVDTKSLLSRTGAGLLALGSSCIVGRLALLYPITLVCVEAVNVISCIMPEESRDRRKLKMVDMLRLAKAGVMLYASTLVLSILMMGFSYGLLCFTFGGFLLGCKASDSTCKQLAAPVASVGAPLSKMAEQVARVMDGQTMDSFRRMGRTLGRSGVREYDAIEY